MSRFLSFNFKSRSGIIWKYATKCFVYRQYMSLLKYGSHTNRLHASHPTQIKARKTHWDSRFFLLFEYSTNCYVSDWEWRTFLFRDWDVVNLCSNLANLLRFSYHGSRNTASSITSPDYLTQGGFVTHKYASVNLFNVSSGKSLSPVRLQIITWTNFDFWLTEYSGAHFY